jgi:TPR repeat protein
MRISSRAARLATGGTLATLAGALCLALGLGFGPQSATGHGHDLLLQPAMAFEGTAAPAVASLTPADKLHSSISAPQISGKAKEIAVLKQAAIRGDTLAQWKLAHAYAVGDGVHRDALRAFHYYSQIANEDADEPPESPRGQIAADAFVALGRYYLKGIPHSDISANRARAHRMFAYAAAYFGDANAQYELGRLYLDGRPTDEHEAARWFLLAASKGQCRAEVALGELLFRGRYVPRQAARGLMWLTLGRDCAGANEPWVQPLYDSAVRHASDDERAMALVYLKDWIDSRHY